MATLLREVAGGLKTALGDIKADRPEMVIYSVYKRSQGGGKSCFHIVPTKNAIKLGITDRIEFPGVSEVRLQDKLNELEKIVCIDVIAIIK